METLFTLLATLLSMVICIMAISGIFQMFG